MTDLMNEITFTCKFHSGEKKKTCPTVATLKCIIHIARQFSYTLLHGSLHCNTRRSHRERGSNHKFGFWEIRKEKKRIEMNHEICTIIVPRLICWQKKEKGQLKPFSRAALSYLSNTRFRRPSRSRVQFIFMNQNKKTIYIMNFTPLLLNTKSITKTLRRINKISKLGKRKNWFLKIE